MTTSKGKCPFTGTVAGNNSAPTSHHVPEMRFDALLESTHDAVMAINSRGLIIFWNQAATKIFGYSEDEALGSSVEIIIPDEYVKAHRAGIERVSSGGARHVIGNTVELTGKRKDGSIIPIELSLSSWTMEETIYFAGIIRDVSERKKHEREIKESEQRFRSLTETASDAIISADHLGNIISWNAAATQIFGHSEKDVIGKSLDIIVPEKFREGHREGLQRVASGGQANVIGQSVELEGLHKNGYTFPIELSLSSWSTENGLHFCGIIRDITERKKQEISLTRSKEQLTKQTLELKAANKKIREKTNELQGLSQKLAKYLSHQVYTSIFEGERDVKIESYRKQLTIFFSDIQGFTELSDKVEAEELTHILNSYLNEMSNIANEHGGTIDKFIGDAIMIFFGDPETRGVKEDALACVRMALDMQSRLAELQRQWEAVGITKPLRVRMGINTGYCTVGNFGSEERMDYTIVGSDVNLAHRLETHAESNQILITQSTYALIRDEIACSAKQEIRAKGFNDPIPTYQVLGEKGESGEHVNEGNSELDKLVGDLNSALTKDDNSTVRSILEKALALMNEKP